jgi:hypothetical protein
MEKKKKKKGSRNAKTKNKTKQQNKEYICWQHQQIQYSQTKILGT